MDVLVIGGGPAGYTAALQAAHQGLSVTLVERADIGGTCLNVGCIPTKSLLETAASWSSAVQHGWIVSSSMTDSHWEDAQQRKRSVVKQLTAGVNTLLQSAGVRTVTGTATFASPNEVVLDHDGVQHRVPFDRALIATGARVALPDIAGMEEQGVYTSDTLLSIEQIPGKLVIVGGGVIGLEFASLFHQLGTHVDVVEFTDEILPQFDVAAVQVLKRQFLAHGISFYTRSSVQQIQRSSSTVDLNVIVRDENGAVFTLQADAVLLAAGRVPRFDSLNAEQIGVKFDHGRIQVNQYCQTNVPHIYAIGDCSNPVMLAHAAMADARVAVDHVLRRDATRKNRFLIPRCIYSRPELASVGMTEEEVIQAGVKYDVSEVSMKTNGKALIAETDGTCRIVFERRTGVVLGIHLVGPHVTELIQEAVLALEMELTVRELARTIHSHPTVSEVLYETALVSMGNPVRALKKQKGAAV